MGRQRLAGTGKRKHNRQEANLQQKRKTHKQNVKIFRKMVNRFDLPETVSQLVNEIIDQYRTSVHPHINAATGVLELRFVTGVEAAIAGRLMLLGFKQATMPRVWEWSRKHYQ